MLWFTVSKAALRSSATTFVMSFSSIPFRIVLQSFSKAVSHENPFLYADWLAGSSLLLDSDGLFEDGLHILISWIDVLNLTLVLRLVICNRLVNLGISKQQHLYLKTKNLI